MSLKYSEISMVDIEEQNGYMAFVRADNEAFCNENGFRRSAFVLTLGCQQNESDSEKLSGMAESMGYSLTDKPEDAYLIIVNTCAIREHAEKRALSLVGQYKHIKQARPETVIAVCGCMTAQEHRVEQIRKSYPYVDLLFGTSSIHRFPELLAERIKKGKRVLFAGELENTVAEDMPVARVSSYKAWVSAMYGCNNFCSYCIVPYVRGRERSRNPENIVKEVKKLVAEGYKEITLLGQNVNSYDGDKKFGVTFAQLLDRVASIEGKFRLRFMTSHPKDFNEDVVKVMQKHRKICRLVHLPVQSGSNRVLQAMNRRYTREKYLDEIAMLRSYFPEAEVTTDIIVGFPGETEEDYLQTEALVKEVDYASAFTFVYSKRQGTKAADMPDQISEDVQKDRIMRLVELVNSLTRKKSEKYVGKTVEILCEDYDEKKGLYQGRDEFGRMGYFESEENVVGEFVMLHVTRANGISLFGELQK